MKLKLFGWEIELAKEPVAPEPVCPDCRGRNAWGAPGRLTLCATCRKPIDPNDRSRFVITENGGPR